jgi:hypothetical protein
MYLSSRLDTSRAFVKEKKQKKIKTSPEIKKALKVDTIKALKLNVPGMGVEHCLHYLTYTYSMIPL